MESKQILKTQDEMFRRFDQIVDRLHPKITNNLVISLKNVFGAFRLLMTSAVSD